MESIITAKTLPLNDLLKHNFYLLPKKTIINSNDINVGDYISFRKAGSYACDVPAIGRVSRKNDKSLWINELTYKPDNLVGKEQEDNGWIKNKYYYFNISENNNLERVELRTSLKNKTIKRINRNFIIPDRKELY